MIYAVAYQKGGVGKSTVAVHLAAYFAAKHNTLLIDGDPQATVATWAAWRRDIPDAPMPTTVQLVGKAIFDEGRVLSQGYETTIIDVAGREGVSIRNALLLADRVIVPMGNSGFDVVLVDEFKELFDQAQAFNRDVQYRVLLNRMRGKTSEVEDFIAETEVPTFETIIGDRRAYAHAVSNGLSVMEQKPAVAAATYEMRKFFEEVEAWS